MLKLIPPVCNRVLALALSLTIFVGCATAPPKKPDVLTPGEYGYTREYLTWLIKKEMRKHKVPGVSIALVDDQRIVWAEGFGYAKKSTKVPATAETCYQVGSISKLFTATAVMQLVEAGKIDIDKPLKTYLPQFSIKTRFPDAAPITPRRMLYHHSGLPSDHSRGMWTATGTPESFTRLVTLLADEYVAYPPNYVFSYSNAGFTLLGHMVQQVSGRDYVAYMDESVLGPLGMTHSSYVMTPEIEPLLSKAYLKGKETDVLKLRDLPAGSLVSNVRDLSRLMMMVFADGRAGNRTILKPETLAKMFQPQNGDVPLDFDLRIGLAWFLGNRRLAYAGPVASHGGSTLLHISQLIVLPKHKLGVVVLTNASTGGAVTGKVAVKALQLMVETKTGIKPPEPAEKPATEVVQVDIRKLADCAGYYTAPFGLMKIEVEGKRLRTNFMGTPIRLLPTEGGRFVPRYFLFGLIPISVDKLASFTFSVQDVGGHRVMVAHDGSWRSLFGEKVEPPPLPERWKDLAGEYEIINLGDDFPMLKKIVVREWEGFLLVEYTMFTGQTINFAVQPVSDTQGIAMGLGRSRRETIFLENRDGQPVVRYMGYEFRRKEK